MSRGSGDCQPVSGPAPVGTISSCEKCSGRLEASAKVYFDITRAITASGGMVTVADMEFSKLNDSYDGHPCAVESELVVSCADCGHEPRFIIRDQALERIAR